MKRTLDIISLCSEINTMDHLAHLVRQEEVENAVADLNDCPRGEGNGFRLGQELDSSHEYAGRVQTNDLEATLGGIVGDLRM
jgi:hypothetical protein